MMALESIIDAYMSARRNKRKSSDQVEFELHWQWNCIRVYNAVNSRSFAPTAYTFITDYPKPREVFASDMATRVLHHYLDLRLRPLLEKRMSRHTWNNRVGMGQTACQNALISDIYKASQGFTRDCWVIKVDMSGCFPNIRQDIAYRQLEDVILEDYAGNDKDELLYMLRVCVFSYPTHHCSRKSPLSKWCKIAPHKSLFNKPDGVGAAIGHLIWQNAVNYYFHDIDEWLISEGVTFERFVDDFCFVTDNKTVFLAYIMPGLRSRLAACGARLNEHKFYCQHYTKGVEWLGCHIKMDRIYPNRRIIHRGMQKARRMNRRISEAKIERFLSSINSYLGVCKNVNGFNQARRIVRCISGKWKQYIHFNRRRVCLEATPAYSYRNRIIHQYKLR